MTVYVDDMHRYPIGLLKVGRYTMKMSHMIADTEEELHAMAAAIGVARRWYQGDHYDIALAKRTLAVRRGAIEITYRQCGLMSSNRRTTGSLGSPETAGQVWEAIRAARRGGNPQPVHAESVSAAGTPCDQRDLFSNVIRISHERSRRSRRQA